MRSAALRAQAVEHWHAEGAHEVAVGAAARCALVQVEPELLAVLVRELLDGARALLGMGAGVRGVAVDDEAEAGKALAGGLQVPARGRRLEHERGRDAARRLLDERPRSEAPDLLVGGEEDAGGAAA